MHLGTVIGPYWVRTILLLHGFKKNDFFFRPLLKVVIEQVTRNDNFSKESVPLRDKHEKLLSVIKKILFIFYGFNLIDALFIYIPHRIDVSNDYYSMTPCFGKIILLLVHCVMKKFRQCRSSMLLLSLVSILFIISSLAYEVVPTSQPY